MSIIAGLQQAPGQAMPMGMGQPPMPGMKPPAGGTPAGVASLVPNKRAQLEMLIERGMQPLQALAIGLQDNSTPPLQTMGAMDEIIKQLNTKRAVANQIAMQQARQQPQTVLQDLAQRTAQAGSPIMARHGGAMHGYRQGGIVGYQSGGGVGYAGSEFSDLTDTPYAQIESAKDPKTVGELASMGAETVGELASMGAEEVKRLFLGSDPTARAVREYFARKKKKEEERKRLEEEETPSLGVGPQLPSQPTSPVPQPRVAPSTTFDITSPSSINALRMAAQDTSLPEEERAALRDRIGMMERSAPPAAPQVKPPAAVAKPDDLETLGNTLRNAGQMTPALEKELRDARAAEMEVRRAAMMGQESRAQEDYDRARRRLEQELNKDRGLFSARGLATLAASISTEPGQVFSSLGKGLEKVYAGEEAARSQAQANYDIARSAFRKEQNLMDERRVLIQERNTAIAERRVEQAMQAQQRLAEIDKEIYKLREERENARFTRETQRISAEAQRTQAGRESETDRKIRLAKEDPALFSQMYGPKDKDLAFPALKAQADLIAERLKDPLLDANQKTALTAEYNKIMVALSKLSGVGGVSGQPLYAVNPKTKERIVSIDGGATWNPAK